METTAHNAGTAEGQLQLHLAADRPRLATPSARMQVAVAGPHTIAHSIAMWAGTRSAHRVADARMTTGLANNAG